MPSSSSLSPSAASLYLELLRLAISKDRVTANEVAFLANSRQQYHLSDADHIAVRRDNVLREI